jgi:hypothetical protein
MRSDLVFQAVSRVSNRYRLCKLATKATRKIHRPSTRLQETINEVLLRFHESNPEAPGARETLPDHPEEWRDSAMESKSYAA